MSMLMDTKVLILVYSVVLLTGIFLGYVMGAYGLLNWKFWSYNVPKMVSAMEVIVKDNASTFVYPLMVENQPTPIYVKTGYMRADLLGFYVPGTNTVYLSNNLRNETKRAVLGHEICHYILHRYGVKDGTQNEEICSAIGTNYGLGK